MKEKQMDTSFHFEGQKAIVTGGLRGIGRAIADALTRCGAQVHVFDIGSGGVQDGDTDISFHTVNIADPEAVTKAVATLPEPASLLVNNAGITRDRTIAKMSDAEWSDVITVNLGGAFNMIRAAAPQMGARGYGRIVNITSINALRGKFGQANYTAAKAGLIGLTKTAAREFGRKGVTVNAVAPGMVMTDMAKALPEKILESSRAESISGELCTLEDIVYGTLFLLSKDAGMITGEVLRIDGGQYI